MKNNTRNIAEVVVLIGVLTISPWFAFFLLLFFITINENDERKEEIVAKKAHMEKLSALADVVQNTPEAVKKQMKREALQEMDEEHTRAITEDSLENPIIYGCVSNFEIYKNFVVDNYNNRFYRVMLPSGKYIEKIYLSAKDAKLDIDLIEPSLPVEKIRGREIYDVRLVK